jgi:NADH dehydrogenase
MAKKSVVVLGAGFGGLRAAMDISKALRHLKLLNNYEVVLVDRNDCHLFIPLLYKVAASPDARHEKTCSYDISSLIKDFPIRFVKDEISSLNLGIGEVKLRNNSTLQADYLIIALGSETNYFGIPGLRENSLELKNFDDAIKIRESIQKAFAKGGDIKIVAGGGGPNGVELAAEIREWANLIEKEKSGLRVSVTIVEALPGILTGFAPGAVKAAQQKLKKLNITTITNAKIVSVAPSEISIDGDEKVPFDIFIWTGGIKTPDMVSQLPINKDQHGRPLAKSDMICVSGTPDLKLSAMVYGIGDSVCFMDPKTSHAVPAIAHAAILEGRIAAHNLIEEIKRAEFSSYNILSETYRPHEYPYVIPVGENWAVAKLGPLVFSGWLGWGFGRIVELNYLLMIMPFARAWHAWQRM